MKGTLPMRSMIVERIHDSWKNHASISTAKKNHKVPKAPRTRILPESNRANVTRRALHRTPRCDQQVVREAAGVQHAEDLEEGLEDDWTPPSSPSMGRRSFGSLFTLEAPINLSRLATCEELHCLSFLEELNLDSDLEL
eukprot:TRINITY_DN13310_c0_g1_i1.p1 TRINITY_DN13310_c0_g1~~TRINITY_DN13310_c0_g1_i1.p1  ORF type:complete len:139 (-),score=15.77 TRINITY_DN13310_c0_g1_i1:476-892(-)